MKKLTALLMAFALCPFILGCPQDQQVDTPAPNGDRDVSPVTPEGEEPEMQDGTDDPAPVDEFGGPADEFGAPADDFGAPADDAATPDADDDV